MIKSTEADFGEIEKLTAEWEKRREKRLQHYNAYINESRNLSYNEDLGDGIRQSGRASFGGRSNRDAINLKTRCDRARQRKNKRERLRREGEECLELLAEVIRRKDELIDAEARSRVEMKNERWETENEERSGRGNERRQSERENERRSERENERGQSERENERRSERENERRLSERENERRQSERENERRQSERENERRQSERENERRQSERENERGRSERENERGRTKQGRERPPEGKAEAKERIDAFRGGRTIRRQNHATAERDHLVQAQEIPPPARKCLNKKIQFRSSRNHRKIQAAAELNSQDTQTDDSSPNVQTKMEDGSKMRTDTKRETCVEKSVTRILGRRITDDGEEWTETMDEPEHKTNIFMLKPEGGQNADDDDGEERRVNQADDGDGDETRVNQVDDREADEDDDDGVDEDGEVKLLSLRSDDDFHEAKVERGREEEKEEEEEDDEGQRVEIMVVVNARERPADKPEADVNVEDLEATHDDRVDDENRNAVERVETIEASDSKRTPVVVDEEAKRRGAAASSWKKTEMKERKKRDRGRGRVGEGAVVEEANRLVDGRDESFSLPSDSTSKEDDKVEDDEDGNEEEKREKNDGRRYLENHRRLEARDVIRSLSDLRVAVEDADRVNDESSLERPADGPGDHRSGVCGDQRSHQTGRREGDPSGDLERGKKVLLGGSKKLQVQSRDGGGEKDDDRDEDGNVSDCNNNGSHPPVEGNRRSEDATDMRQSSNSPSVAGHSLLWLQDDDDDDDVDDDENDNHQRKGSQRQRSRSPSTVELYLYDKRQSSPAIPSQERRTHGHHKSDRWKSKRQSDVWSSGSQDGGRRGNRKSKTPQKSIISFVGTMTPRSPNPQVSYQERMSKLQRSLEKIKNKLRWKKWQKRKKSGQKDDEATVPKDDGTGATEPTDADVLTITQEETNDAIEEESLVEGSTWTALKEEEEEGVTTEEEEEEEEVAVGIRKVEFRDDSREFRQDRVVSKDAPPTLSSKPRDSSLEGASSRRRSMPKERRSEDGVAENRWVKDPGAGFEGFLLDDAPWAGGAAVMGDWRSYVGTSILNTWDWIEMPNQGYVQRIVDIREIE